MRSFPAFLWAFPCLKCLGDAAGWFFLAAHAAVLNAKLLPELSRVSPLKLLEYGGLVMHCRMTLGGKRGNLKINEIESCL